MSFFQQEYQKALTTTHDYTTPNKPIHSFYPSISTEAIDNLFYVLNYGTIQLKYPHSITLSTLNAYLILYTTEGQGLLVYNNNRYLLKPNSIVFIDCSKGFHLEVFHSSSWSYQWFYVNSNSISYYYQQFIFDDIPVYDSKLISNLHNPFSKLMDYTCNETTEEIILSLLLDNLITTIIVEKHSLIECEQIPKYIENVKKLFDTRYYESFDLDLVAKTFKVSKYTLSRDFTKYIKISPIEYLIQARILASKQLLVESDLTINEIAAKVGIDNATHFINLFKKRVGITPLQYRKQHSIEVAFLIDC